MNKHLLVAVVSCILCYSTSFGQLSESSGSRESWKGTRLVSAHCPGVLEKAEWQFRIDHRFADAGEGFYDFFGLDGANIRIGLEYGVFEELSLGVGRSTEKKTYDAFVKYAIVEDKALGNVVVSLSFFCDAHINSSRWPEPERENHFSSRLSYSFQLPMSFLVGPKYLIILSPTIMHRNLVPTINDVHDIKAIGVGSSWKLSNVISLSSEYFYVLPNQLPEGSFHPMMFSIDFNTSGHSIQLVMGNSQGMNNRFLLSETTRRGLETIYLGFNLSRRFASKAGQ